MQRVASWIYRALGAGVAVGVVGLLAGLSEEPLTRVPFVTSIVLTMVLPDSDGAQPYAVIGGPLLSTAAGFIALWCLGPGATASAVAVGIAALLMLSCSAIHPPAGIDAFLICQFGLPLGWALTPVLVGAVLLALFSQLWAAGEWMVVPRMPVRR